MSQRFLSGVAAALLVLGLASCGDGGDGPVTTPPPEIDLGQSDSGGTEPSDGGASSDEGGSDGGAIEAAPDISPPDPADYPGMDEETPEGAEQAFRFFWDTSIAGYQGGDHGQLAMMSADDCRNCHLLIDQIQDLKNRGEFWSAVTTSEVALEAEGGGENYDYVVTYSFIVPEHTEPTDDPGQPAEWDEITYTSTGGLIWSSGKWVLVDFSSDFTEGSEAS